MPEFYKYEIDIRNLVVHDGDDVQEKDIVSKYVDMTYPKTNIKVCRDVAIVYFSKDTLELFEKLADNIQLFNIVDNNFAYEISPTDVNDIIDDDIIHVSEGHQYFLRTNDAILASKLKLKV